MPMQTKVMQSLFWVSISMGTIKILNLITNIALARLLAPSDFGLISIGLIIVNFFEIFRDFGLGAALIHKKEDLNNESANTAFFIFPIIASFLYIISFFLAPLASDFFNEPKAELIIKVISLSFLIWSFGVVPNILLRKDLEFKKKIIPDVIPKIVYTISTILFAINGFGVWSLVVGRLIFEFSSVVLNWSVINWRPRNNFNKKLSTELIGYGRHVMWTNLAVFLISVIDVAFVGRMLGIIQLGFYTIALTVGNLFSVQIAQLIGAVMFPAYSKLHGDSYAIKNAYLKTLKYVSFFSIPTSFLLFMVAQDFLTVLYGEKWLPATIALKVLCFYGLGRSILYTTENLYLATGKPEISKRINSIQLILMSLLIYPFIQYFGILGASLGATIPSMFMIILTLREAGKIVKENTVEIARMLLSTVLSAMIMVSGLFVFQQIFIFMLPPYLKLFYSIAIAIFLYSGCIWFLDREILYELQSLINRLRS